MSQAVCFKGHVRLFGVCTTKLIQFPDSHLENYLYQCVVLKQLAWSVRHQYGCNLHTRLIRMNCHPIPKCQTIDPISTTFLTSIHTSKYHPSENDWPSRLKTIFRCRLDVGKDYSNPKTTTHPTYRIWSYLYVNFYCIMGPSISYHPQKQYLITQFEGMLELCWFSYWLKQHHKTSWWFQPIWKILVKMGIFPK